MGWSSGDGAVVAVESRGWLGGCHWRSRRRRRSCRSWPNESDVSDFAGPEAEGATPQAGQRFGRGETGSAVPDLGEQPGGADGAGAGREVKICVGVQGELFDDLRVESDLGRDGESAAIMARVMWALWHPRHRRRRAVSRSWSTAEASGGQPAGLTDSPRGPGSRNGAKRQKREADRRAKVSEQPDQ